MFIYIIYKEANALFLEENWYIKCEIFLRRKLIHQMWKIPKYLDVKIFLKFLSHFSPKSCLMR